MTTLDLIILAAVFVLLYILYDLYKRYIDVSVFHQYEKELTVLNNIEETMLTMPDSVSYDDGDFTYTSEIIKDDKNIKVKEYKIMKRGKPLFEMVWREVPESEHTEVLFYTPLTIKTEDVVNIKKFIENEGVSDLDVQVGEEEDENDLMHRFLDEGIDKTVKILVVGFMLLAFGFTIKANVGCDDDYTKLVKIARSNDFKVTSTTGGRHNKYSKHYIGKAIDVRTRNKADHEIEEFMFKLKNMGAIVLDERERHEEQRVWTGPHLHISIPDCLEFVDPMMLCGVSTYE